MKNTDEQIKKVFFRFYEFRPHLFSRGGLMMLIEKGYFDSLQREKEELVRMSDAVREEMYPTPVREFL